MSQNHFLPQIKPFDSQSNIYSNVLEDSFWVWSTKGNMTTSVWSQGFLLGFYALHRDQTSEQSSSLFGGLSPLAGLQHHLSYENHSVDCFQLLEKSNFRINRWSLLTLVLPLSAGWIAFDLAARICISGTHNCSFQWQI